MEVKIQIKNIENLKTTTGIREEEKKIKLITRIQFEAEIDPASISGIHHLLAEKSPVHVLIGSPQAIMEILEKEPAFAEK